jgi:hypothetical protein
MAPDGAVRFSARQEDPRPVDFNPHATAALEYASEVASRASATLIVVYADTLRAARRAPGEGKLKEGVDLRTDVRPA